MKKIKLALKKTTAVILSAAMIASMAPGELLETRAAETKVAENDNNLRLWYTSAAPNTAAGWENWSLPLGNSAIGASVFGGVASDRLQLTEKSLWAGGPSTKRPDYNGGNVEAKGQNGATMKAIQEAFARGDTATANSLCGSSMTGFDDGSGNNGYGYFLSYGNMYLDFQGMTDSNVQNYVRDLDLETAVSSVQYDYDGIHYTREYFVSYPDNVLVTRLSSDRKAALDVAVRIVPDEAGGDYAKRNFTNVAKDGVITIAGSLNDNQMKFNSQTKVINTGGTRTDDGSKVKVAGADSIVIITSIGTDYKNEYPKYRTGDTDAQLSAKVAGYVNTASAKTYDKLKADHIADYDNIFGRVDLQLGQIPSQKTTDALLSAYKTKAASEPERRNLEVMLFQYGRYLTIASSRESGGDPKRETLPSNLQGIWAGGNSSPWHSDYHMNVNLQMNYWPAYSTNMAECAEPLIDYVDSLREPGRVTAKIYAGIESTEENPENGFMAHTQNNPFGWTCPGWIFDWGWSPAAVPWILQNCWEHYEYTGDLEYMKKNIYPMLKEEAVLYSQMLIEDPDGGGLVCSPAYSPEQGPRTNGNIYEQTLIWQLYEDVVTAGKLVGEDEALLAEWKDKQSRLKGPVEIGDSGQIKEWFHETTFNKDKDGNTIGGQGKDHRHMSHLLGLFPGDLISVETPELLDAAVWSLTNRVDKTTGWGMGQRINSWARTGDGEHAYKLITDLFDGGILTNLWDTHPPFQIDGNFGMTSGVAEMLLQSNMGYINILPALPSAWADGQVEGLVARGNFEINMKWKDQKASEVTVLSKNGGEAQVQAKGIIGSIVTDMDGNLVNYTVISQNRIAFNTQKGKTYNITNISPQAELSVPQNLQALRTTDDAIALSWTALEAEDVTYTLYRQAGKGEVQMLAEGLTEASYEDDTASDLLGDLKYQIQAFGTVDGNEISSKLSAQVSAQDLRSMAGMIDDRDARITYSSGWSTYGEAGLYNETSTFIAAPKGNETASFNFKGNGIEVYATVQGDRGIAEIWIDGKKAGDADSYKPSKANYVKIFEKTGLDNKLHTLEMRVVNKKNPSSTGTKFEFDAFKVLDETISVNSVTVTSKSGITTVAKPGASLQMQAAVDTQNKNKKVAWKVTDTSGKATTLAAISEDGLLTVGETSGTVRVTATSQLSTSVSGSVDITITIPGEVQMESQKKDFTVRSGGASSANNTDFTWTGTWGTWNADGNGEDGKNHDEKDKIESKVAGSSVTGKFTGTKLEIYGHRFTRAGKFKLEIDDKEPIEVNANYTGDLKDSLLYKAENLDNKEHTMKITVLENDGFMVALDYCMVYKPKEVTGGADKSGLQDVILANENNFEEKYTPESWTAYKAAYGEAVAAMNKDGAAEAEITAAITALNEKAGALVEKAVLPKPDVTGASAKVLNTESTSITLGWSPVDTAVSYNIYKGAELLGEATDCVYRVEALTAATEYTFTVEAVNRIGQKASLTPVTASTSEVRDVTPPTNVENLSKSGAVLTWDASTDESSTVSYEVCINGARVAATEATTYTLTGLTPGENYTVMVYALDTAGNKSVPAALSFRQEGGTEVVTITAVTNPAAITVEYGTEFGELNLPAKVTVTLSDGKTAQPDVTWNSDQYSATRTGKQTISGELGAIAGVQNTRNLKASIDVTVKEKPLETVTITAVTKPAAITADYGTEFGRLNLPANVTVTLSNGKTAQAGVTWKSSDYTATKAGKQTINGDLGSVTGAVNTGNLKASIDVTVKEEVITITAVTKPAAITVAYGTEFAKLNLPEKVTVTLSSGKTAQAGVTWKSSDYTATKAGKQTISGELAAIQEAVNSKNLKASIEVTVQEKELPVVKPLESISLNKNVLELKKDATEKLIVSFLPADTTDSKEVIWTSSNPAAASVGTDGTVTAVSAGTAVITAACGKLSATCAVTVTAAQPVPPTPEKPANLTKLVQKTQGTSWITLSWAKVSNADGYLVYRYDTKAKKDILIDTIANGNTVSYKVRKVNGSTGSKLSAGASYTFKVVPYKTVNGQKITGEGKTLKTATATKAPVLRKIKKKSSTSVLIQWNRIKSANGYEVFMSQKKKAGYKRIKPISKNSIVKLTQPKLKKGKTYYFKVRTYKTVNKKKIYSSYSKLGSVKM